MVNDKINQDKHTKQKTIAQALLCREQAGEFLTQRTKEWYATRRKILTASEISSVLDSNIYKSGYDLMLQKLTQLDDHQPAKNEATDWGVKYEPIALQFYEFLKKEKVYEIGLIIHAIHKWLGASPDGLLLNGRLLEIKCPKYRNITGEVPEQYWIQMQIQMEVSDIDTCDYLECSFYQYADKAEYDADSTTMEKGMFNIKENIKENIYWKLNKCFLKTIARDKKWFATNMPIMKQFHDTLVACQTNGLEQLYRMNHLGLDNTISDNTFSADNTIRLTNWRKWVSATQIRNYMMDDPLIDWLEYYYDNERSRPSYIKYEDGNYTFVDKSLSNNVSLDKFVARNNLVLGNDHSDFYSCLMEKGTVFENNVIHTLKNKFGTHMATIANYQQARSRAKYLETIYHMKKGTPIIYQAVLHDHRTRTYGMPDLLVRSDWINKLVSEPVLSKSRKSHKCKFNKAWHYVVVEIKYSSLNLCADGKHLRNSKSISSFKWQLYIYDKILGSMQGYTPTKSYILGKHWSYKKNAITYFGSSFERLAHINFGDQDAFIRSKTADAVRWVRDVRLKGDTWKLIPPSRNELRPNMCNPDPKWQAIKSTLATKTNDITQLWMCGPRNREIAIDNGVRNWRRQPIVSEDLGITGDKVANTLQLILDYNQDPRYVEPFIPMSQLKTKNLIYPKKIKNNSFNWRKPKGYAEFFIDFETVANSVADADIIFMIGIGHITGLHTSNKITQHTEPVKWKFKTFCLESMTTENEGKMLVEFHTYINKITNEFKAKYKKARIKFKGCNMYHWGHHERTSYRSAVMRHMDIIPKGMEITQWCDFLTVFKDEPIVVRGSLNFGLKSIVKAMYNNAFINTRWEDSKISNGLNAMVYAWQEHVEYSKTGKSLTESKIIQDIIIYNEVDCKVIWEIMKYLREHHI
jgi:putative phage-type endonuclease